MLQERQRENKDDNVEEHVEDCRRDQVTLDVDAVAIHRRDPRLGDGRAGKDGGNGRRDAQDHHGRDKAVYDDAVFADRENAEV